MAYRWWLVLLPRSIKQLYADQMTLGMINTLQNSLSVTEDGKDSGVLTLNMVGEDKDQTGMIILTASPTTWRMVRNRKKRRRA